MKPTLVLLHGWGAHGRVWDQLAAGLGGDMQIFAPDLPGHGVAPVLSPYTIECVIDQLADIAPAQCAIAGWSLGGQLALAWAHRYPQQITRLMLVSSTPRFVSAPDWAHGMAPEVFAEFSAALADDAEATLRRFLLLQTQGDVRMRPVTRQLQEVLALQPQPHNNVLLETLHWLRITDLRAVLPEIKQPVLVLHGDCDTITPPAASEYLAAHLARARLVLMAGAAHAPFISDADAVCKLMNAFCNE